jgi:hypothetical protein
MSLVVSLINALVVGAVGIVLAWLGKGRFDGLDARIDRLEERMDRFEVRTDRFQEHMEARMDALRSDLTQVALAVGVPRRATTS